MLDEIFRQEVERYQITIFEGVRMVHATFLTPYPWGAFRLSVSDQLHGPWKVEAAGMQIARIALGHDFRRSGFRQEYVNRREWDSALLWLATRLIPDRLMSRAARLSWDAWELAEAADVTEAIAWRRGQEWFKQRGRLLHFVPRSEPSFARDAGGVPFFDN